MHRHLQALLLFAAAFLLAGPVAQAAPAADADVPPPVTEGYTTPLIAVPYATVKPTMDGVVNDAEWQGAASVDLLRARRGGLSSRPTRYWLSWDEDNLYLAMRSALRPGERPVQRFRGEGGDPYVVMDDSYEFYFDTGGKEAGDLPAYIQYIGNFAGEKYDTAHLPTVGTRRMSYEAGWEPHNRIVETPEGRAWEMEVTMPRASLLIPEPIAAGMEIRALLARNFKRPWEQNSIEAASVFFNTATYTRLRLEKAVPSLHVLGASSQATQNLGLKLAAWSPVATTLKWRFASDSGLVKEGDFAVPAGAYTLGVDALAMESLEGVDPKQPGNYRVQVTTADGTLLFDWASLRRYDSPEAATQTFEDDKGEDVKLSLVLNPVKDYLRITGDFINFDARAQIATTRVTVQDAAGKTLADKQLQLDDYAFVRDVAQLPDLAPGTYTARLVCLDAAGKTMVERETEITKKDHATEFPWWHTTRGSIERVIPPWTPVQRAGETLSVLGRSMAIGAAGLPSAITVEGEPILAGPARLEATPATGAPYSAGPATVTVESEAAHRVVAVAASQLGELAVSSRVTTEFDGMYKVEMTVSPRDPGTPVSLKGLRVVVPLTSEYASYLTACGEGIRWGYDHRELPADATGELWNCLRVDGQRMAVGSFIPYVWIGGTRRGLAWFADSDQGWAPNDAVPAITVRREAAGGSVDLVLNLVSSDLTIDAPRTLTFAFQATPVKPLAPDWRTHVYDFGDSFSEWQQAQKIGSNRMQSPVPWTYDPEKSAALMDRHRAEGRMLSIYRAPIIPYGRHNETLAHRIPEARYFAEHWNSKNSWHIFYDDSLIDYWVYKLDEWITVNDIDGYYSDNVHPAVCYNVEAGRGYYLPDGRVQPGYNIFGIRRYFLRVRAVFAEHGKTGWIVNHMTHNMVMPWMGAVDIALDGEDHHITAQQDRTYLDAWPLARLRADLPETLGVGVTYKVEFDTERRWEPGHRYSFNQVWRSYVAAMQLHDNLPMDGYQLPTHWFEVRHRYGFNAPGARFIGYWEPGKGITWDNKDVQISAWVLPGKVLLLPVGFARNRADSTTTVTLDAAALGLPPKSTWRVTNAEGLANYSYYAADGKPVDVYPFREQLITLNDDGTITLKVPHHDYRMIVIEANKPE